MSYKNIIIGLIHSQERQTSHIYEQNSRWAVAGQTDISWLWCWPKGKPLEGMVGLF